MFNANPKLVTRLGRMKISWLIIVKPILVSMQGESDQIAKVWPARQGFFLLFIVVFLYIQMLYMQIHKIIPIIYHFNTVVKMKFRQARKRSLWGRKVNTVYKTWRGTSFELKKLRKPKFRLESSDACCSDWIGNSYTIAPWKSNVQNEFDEIYTLNNN